MLLIDGVKYNLWRLVEEEQLESMIKEHSKEIFGKDSVYFDLKQKLISKAGVASIPDGYVISFSKPFDWYIVEVELSNHPLHEHITNQLNKFMTGMKNPSTQKELVDTLYKEIDNNKLLRAFVENMIGSTEIKGFLYDLIPKTPKIVVVIEEKGDKVQEACDGLKVEPIVREFKTFVREDAENVHAHLFEPIVMPKIVTEKPFVEVEKAELKLGEVKIGDTLEQEVKTTSPRTYAYFPLPKNRRRFFPGYKVEFILETDIGDIKTRVSGARAGTPIGDPDGGVTVQGGLREWYNKHPELTVGRKVRFECIEPYKKYKLLVV
jgi:hypothetical protein